MQHPLKSTKEQKFCATQIFKQRGLTLKDWGERVKKVCTHEFGPTKQFLFKNGVKETRSHAFELGINVPPRAQGWAGPKKNSTTETLTNTLSYTKKIC